MPSPTDRAVLWRIVLASGPEDRGSLLHVLGREVLDSVGRRLDLDRGHDDETVETVVLLDASRLPGRDDLREAFEEADEDDDRAQAFAALLAGHLGKAADMDRLGADARVRAVRLSATWQEHVLDRAPARHRMADGGVGRRSLRRDAAGGRQLDQGRPGESRADPGRLVAPAADQFTRGRVDPRRIAALQAMLIEQIGDAPRVSDEELADEIVRRRQQG